MRQFPLFNFRKRHTAEKTLLRKEQKNAHPEMNISKCTVVPSEGCEKPEGRKQSVLRVYVEGLNLLASAQPLQLVIGDPTGRNAVLLTVHVGIHLVVEPL